MNSLKNVLLTGLVILAGLNCKADSKGDPIIIHKDLTLNVGDTIVVNYPHTSDFLYVQPKKKINLDKVKKIARIGSNIGSAAVGVGVLGNSAGLIGSGADLSTAGSAIYSAGNASEDIASLNASKKAKKIIGKKLVVVSLVNEDPTFESANIVAQLEGENQQYEIALLPAFYFGEILIHNTHISNLEDLQQELENKSKKQ